MIEEDLYTALKSVVENVYPIIMPDDCTFPVITYQVVFDGANQSTNGKVMSRNVRFQVDIYSKSYLETKILKEKVIKKVVELRGGSISAQDLYEDQINLYRELIDFKIRRT